MIYLIDKLFEKYIFTWIYILAICQADRNSPYFCIQRFLHVLPAI